VGRLRSNDTPGVDPRSRRFHIVNFGCRASQSEGAAIEAELLTGGRRSAESPFEADVVVINSCTVTAEADRDVDRLIRRLNRRNPEASIIVTGCYAQRSPETLAARPQVRYVVGNSHKSLTASLAGESMDAPDASGRSEVFCSQIFELVPLEHQGSAGRTRATIKVQDGCNATCSFCIIPAVRGGSRSLELPLVVRQVEDLVAQGYREVVFSGIHLGSWGRDLRPAMRFTQLIGEILAEVPGLERLRLSSVEPLEVTSELVSLIASTPRIARHLHIPLQSGSSRILRAMRRPYDAQEYTDRIRSVRVALPGAAIGADVMVGFPGESDQDFLETVRLIESIPLTYLHVFPYSPRPGTLASGMGDRVPEHVARFRSQTLLALSARKSARFRSQFVGRRLQVLALGSGSVSEGPEGGCRGLSDNFIDVRLDSDVEANRWHDVRIQATTDVGLDAIRRPGGAQDSRMTMAAETV